MGPMVVTITVAVVEPAGTGEGGPLRRRKTVWPPSLP